jgi:hypothetical protein
MKAVCPFPEYCYVEAHMDSTADIDALKRDAFLRYLNQQAGGDTSTVFKIGDVGDAMGLPYEEVIRISDTLCEQGSIRRVGRFDPPHGPGVQLTRAGLRPDES